MTDRPIIFSAPMVRALLDGRKSQTRRKVPVSRYAAQLDGYSSTGRLLAYYGDRRLGLEFVHDKLGLWDAETNPGGRSAWYVPIPYAVGDRLWVRETWQHAQQRYCSCPQPSEPAPCDDWCNGTGCRSNRGDVIYRAEAESLVYWRNPIHMPRWASRLTLLVTDVRVQRLQDISEDDAAAEGVPRTHSGGAWGEEGLIEDFADLWNTLHGPDAWDANPWVAAVSFAVHHGNIDQIKPEEGR